MKIRESTLGGLFSTMPFSNFARKTSLHTYRKIGIFIYNSPGLGLEIDSETCIALLEEDFVENSLKFAGI